MALHPTLQGFVDAAAKLPPMESFTPQQVRAGDDARFAAIPRPPVGAVEDRMIPGPRGEIRIRIYTPEAAAPSLPVITFFHGSGFCICSIETHDGLCRQLCNRANAVVVSVDYALAPEHKFPAGIEDSIAATRWVGAHADSLGADPARLVLAGDSAGGTMAIVSALRLRDEDGPPLAALLLIYPVTNYPDPAPPSYPERGEGCGLTANGMRWFWSHYLRNPAEGVHPDASPLRAETFAGLPPTYVITAEYDILRDEGEAFAHRMENDGVDCTLIRYGDMNHGFMSLVGVMDRADEALYAACAWLAGRL